MVGVADKKYQHFPDTVLGHLCVRECVIVRLRVLDVRVLKVHVRVHVHVRICAYLPARAFACVRAHECPCARVCASLSK